MTGEDLSRLSVNDLSDLENQLQMSLRGVRMRKVCLPILTFKMDPTLLSFKCLYSELLMNLLNFVGPTSDRRNTRPKQEG